jgi:hypothetical protein
VRQQRGRHAEVPHLLGHGERHLGAVVLRAPIGGVRDDPVIAADRNDPIPARKVRLTAASAAQSMLAPPEK